MKSTYLSALFTDTFLTVAGLVIFFALFVLWFAWVYFRKDAIKTYEQMAQLPLRGDGDFHEQL